MADITEQDRQKREAERLTSSFNALNGHGSFPDRRPDPFEILQHPADQNDFYAREERRLQAAAEDISTTPNGFREARIATVKAMAASKRPDPGNAAESKGKREEKERREKDRRLIQTLEIIQSLRDSIDQELLLLQGEINQCTSRIASLEQAIQSTDQQVTQEKENVHALEDMRQEKFLKSEKYYREKILDADETLQNAQKDYDSVKDGANPEQDNDLKNQALTKNRDALDTPGQSFDQMTKEQQDAALVKYLQENDPGNAFLKTAEARKIILDTARQDLQQRQREYLDAVQNKFLKAYERTGHRIAEKEKNIQRLAQNNEENKDAILKEKEDLQSLKERENRLHEKSRKLDELQQRAQKGDPSAEEEIRQMIEDRQNRRARRYEILEARNADPATLPSRTSTDSAAGLVAGSAIEKMDKVSATAFNKAASGNVSAEPSPDAPDAYLAAGAGLDQKRQQPAPGSGRNV